MPWEEASARPIRGVGARSERRSAVEEAAGGGGGRKSFFPLLVGPFRSAKLTGADLGLLVLFRGGFLK